MSFEVLEICNVLKEVTYFGHSLNVPKDTIAIATDPEGNVQAFSGTPRIDPYENWIDDTGHSENITECTFLGNWKDSLVVLENKMSDTLVGYQYRFFDSPHTVTPGWGPWTDCDERKFNDTIEYINHGYRYEVRKLYAGPVYRKHRYEIDENNDIISTKAEPDKDWS